MAFDNYDIYFPHLNFGIKHLVNSVDVFGFRIAYYGIIIGIGMLLGVLIASIDYKRRGKNPDDISDLALYGIIIAILGARAYYVLFEWSYYAQHPSEILNIRQGGLAIYGGIIAAVLVCIVFCKVRKIHFFDIADSAVLGLLIGQSVGRWGNFFNAEAFGGYTDNLLAMRIKEAIVNPNMLNDDVLLNSTKINDVLYIQVHPTFFYESFWNLCTLLLLFFVVSPKKKFTGQVFWSYVFFYGVGRFWIEGLRTDSLYIWGTHIAVSQALSGVLAIVAFGEILYRLHKTKKELPKADDGTVQEKEQEQVLKQDQAN